MPTREQWFLLLADVVLLVHFAFVLFVVLGFVGIWLGWFRRWRWVRKGWFRAAHLGAIGVVAAEAIGGVVCPLTTWENQLRLAAGGGERYAASFMQHWVHRVMFFEAEPKVFTVIYVVFFVLVLLSLVVVRPRWPWRKKAPCADDAA